MVLFYPISKGKSTHESCNPCDTMIKYKWGAIGFPQKTKNTNKVKKGGKKA